AEADDGFGAVLGEASGEAAGEVHGDAGAGEGEVGDGDVGGADEVGAGVVEDGVGVVDADRLATAHDLDAGDEAAAGVVDDRRGVGDGCGGGRGRGAEHHDGVLDAALRVDEQRLVGDALAACRRV